jgi:hypothetical protein
MTESLVVHGLLVPFEICEGIGEVVISMLIQGPELYRRGVPCC